MKMLKIIGLFLMGLTLLSFSDDPFERYGGPSPHSAIIIGKVKSIKEFYTCFDEKMKGWPSCSDGNCLRLFDEKGNGIKIFEDGILDGSSTFIYDSIGNKIEHDYFFKGVITYKTFFKYDKRGNMIEKNTYDVKGKKVLTGTCEYNENGNLVKIEEQGSYGSQGRNYMIKYDEKGHETQYFDLDLKGNIVNKTVVICDPKGNIIEEKVIMQTIVLQGGLNLFMMKGEIDLKRKILMKKVKLHSTLHINMIV